MLGLVWALGALGFASGRGENRDEFSCPPGQMVEELQSVDGFLEIRCASFPARCDRAEGPPRCLGVWRNRCGMQQYVSGIQRRFAGRRAKLYYKVQCCGHPAIDVTEQYVNQFTRSFGVEEVFNAGGQNQGSGFVQYVANIVGTSRRDHQTVVIGQLKCDEKTTTTQRTTTTERRTTTLRPTTVRPQREHQDSSDGLKPTDMRPGHGPPPGAFAGASAACFPPDALVLTADDGLRPMDQLRVGDHIASESWAEGREAFSRVTGFLHRDPLMEATYVTLTTRSGARLSLTDKHLLPAFTCPDFVQTEFGTTVTVGDVLIQQATIMAKKLRIGDCVLTGNLTLEPIEEIRLSRLVGAFAPVTESGSVVVSGVRASCYSNVESQYVQHGLFRSWALVVEAAAGWAPGWVGALLSDAAVHEPSAALPVLEALFHLCLSN